MKKNIMITQFLNNIKKTAINLFPLYCMKKNYMREKKKDWKHWVLLGTWPKAILGSSGGRTQLKCVLLGRTQLNIFSLGLVAQPNPISIYLKTKFKKIQKHQKYYFEVKKTIKKFEIFFKAFLKCKNKNALIKKFNPTWNEKKILSPNFCII